MTPCKHTGTNHSPDTVNVWHGSETPLTLCGFHASRLNPARFAFYRESGVISD